MDNVGAGYNEGLYLVWGAATGRPARERLIDDGRHWRHAVPKLPTVVWVGNAFVFVVIAPLLVAAEWANPECPMAPAGCSPLRHRRTDWAFAAVQLALVPAVGLGTALGASAVVAHGPLHRVVASLPATATAVFAFLVADLVAYWTHRAEHRSRYMWRFHSVHHSSRRMDWLAGRRFHPVDVVLQPAVTVAVVAGLGVPLVDLAPYFFAAWLVTMLAHCNVSLPGRWLARAVVTPGYHRSHHERGREGSNFALVLPLMDMLFGTACFGAGARTFGAPYPVPESGFLALLGWGFGWPNRAQRVSTSTPVQNDTALAT